MSENTNEPKKLKKVDKKTAENKIGEKDKSTKKAKSNKIENKSVQNKVIDNIKNFISKIIEMQEKVKNDENEEKIQKEVEKNDVNVEKEEISAQKYLLEYYDLPFRYKETIVRILAQTPKRLFVYWDVADEDKQLYIDTFGENFFNDTYPVLLIHNEDKNYTREVAINDFANSWYLDISDSRDKYTIQLGRKFKSYVKPQINSKIEKINITINNDYLPIVMSNELEVPNDHILFEEFKPYIKYRNVKTKEENVKNVDTSAFNDKLENIYNKLYDGQLLGNEYDLLNPSSMGTSSMFAHK